MLSPDTPYPIEQLSKGIIFLKNFISNPNIEVGDYTYYDGRDGAENFEKTNVVFGFSSKLIIGKFCQLAYGTKFLLSDANHAMSGFSAFPFFIFGKFANCPEWEYEPDLPDKGATIVGHDVWFGHESMVMPGVKIGSGSIIGARAVVTKDVPPYSIVGGNPAKIVRKRFADPVIEQLLDIQWWNWSFDKISRNLDAILKADLQKLRDSR